MACDNVILCSDLTGPTELHRSDFARQSAGVLKDSPTPNTLSIVSMCETEVSSQCPSGWAFYSDVNGSEGYDSCVLVSTSTAASWTAASNSCTSGSHLLTVKSPVATSGLLTFATSLVASSENLYVGCSQATGASERGTGWTWIDGTDATNLACANGLGCGIWASSEPK